MNASKFYNQALSSFRRAARNAAPSTPQMQRKWMIACVGITLFGLLEYALFLYADRPLAASMKSLDATHPDLINFFRSITDLGKGVWYLAPCGLILIFCGFLSRGKDVPPVYRRLFAYIGVRAFFLFATIGISGIIADIIKPLAGRARPLLWLRDGVYGFDPFNRLGSLWNGMPSGHTTTAFALAFSLSFLYPRLRVLWFSYALLLASSRIMVDAHYLSDVCAGALLGWATVWIFTKCGMIQLWKVIFPIDMELVRK
jgi:membrane-associated phospholipid phosphatase